MKRPKTGGRKKGTPNRVQDETRRLIEATLGCSPLERMARLAKELLDGERVLLVPVTMISEGERWEDAEASDAKAVEVATKLLSEISQYHSPKRKAVEHTGLDGAPLGPLVAFYLPSNARDGESA